MQTRKLVRSTQEARTNPGPLLIEVYKQRDLSPVLLSNYRWAAKAVSGMADQSFRFRRAVVDLTNRQVHLLGLLLALRNGPHGAGETGLGDFAGRFLSEPPNKLIAELYGDCPPGTLGCLGKLPVRSVLGWRVYLDLLELLVEPRAAKVLLHATRITAKMIKDLKRVDPILRRVEFLAAMREYGSLDTVSFLIRSIFRHCPNVDHRVVLESLATIREPAGIEKWYMRWLDKAPLPAPPWSGTDTIRPLNSVAAMKAAAKIFQNCIANRVSLVLAGDRYYYLYLHPTNSRSRAIIEVIHDQHFGWAVNEIRGVENRPPTPRLMKTVISEFERAGIYRLPDFDEIPDRFNPQLWF